jgi:hypothetical protein
MKLAAPGLCRISRLGKPLRHAMIVLAVAVVYACAARGDVWASLPPQAKAGADFLRALSVPLDDVVWSAGTPLRQALATLARAQNVAIMLDRRIDPGSAIELSVRNASVREVLEQLAAQCAAVPTYLDGVVYIGPRATTIHLASIAQERRAEAERLPRGLAQRVTAKRAWRWDDLAEPRALVAELAREADVEVENTQQLPHDLWPALELPALPWTDRMTLVLAGFGLTFTLDEGRTVRLTPLPTPEVVSRTYPAILSSSQVETIKSLFPQATIDERGSQVELAGTPDEHERLKQLLQRQTSGRAPGRAGGKAVYTLKVNQQPIQAILKTLERQVGVKFQIGADVAERLDTRVSFDVHEVPLSELLDAALAPAGLDHRREGDTIVIAPREQ